MAKNSYAPKSGEDLRRTLLDVSLELIAREGLERFSMREVARRAGVSHQAPYHYFNDREAILAEIVAEGFDTLRDSMLNALEGVAEPSARLAAIGRAYVAFALANPAHFKLMFRSELVHTGRHVDADAGAKSAFGVLVDVVNDVAPAERSSQSDPSPLVLASWSLAHGLATLLIEGRLDETCGKARHLRAAAADRVLKAFETLVREKPRR